MPLIRYTGREPIQVTCPSGVLHLFPMSCKTVSGADLDAIRQATSHMTVLETGEGEAPVGLARPASNISLPDEGRAPSPPASAQARSDSHSQAEASGPPQNFIPSEKTKKTQRKKKTAR